MEITGLKKIQLNKMKSAHDPRHKKRQKLVKQLFAITFIDQEVSPLVRKITKKRKIIDPEIQKAAPTWPIDKLNKVDLSILRLAVYELKENLVPSKVIIDEAVELAKEFGSENSASFINGVLGTILKKLPTRNRKK